VLDPTSQAASILAEKGVLGVLILVLAFVLYRKDQELTAERQARLDDAKKFTDRLLALQTSITDTVGKLVDLHDTTKEFMTLLREAVTKLGDAVKGLQK
jgi:hypothetical protein